MVVNKSATIEGSTFTLKVEQELAPLGEWLLGMLIKIHQKGGGLRGGSRVQMGWSMLTLTEERPDCYLVCEPDFGGNPFEGIMQNVTKTLIGQSWLNDFAEKIGVAPVFPLFKDKVVLEKGSLGASDIFMNRGAPQDEDSGWFIGGREKEDAPKDLEAIYIYDLFNRRPDLFPVLALPPGYVVICGRGGIEAVLDESDQIVWSK